MVKYRRAKEKSPPATSVETAAESRAKPPVEGASEPSERELEKELADLKRIPYNSVKLTLAGDMVVVKCPDPKLEGFFRRYQELFESLANMEPSERLLNYKFLCGLMLTGHARRIKDIPQRRHVFDLKNHLYFAIAKSPESRRRVSFRYLKSKRVRVLEYCDGCQKTNTEANTPKHEWTHCDHCKVDKDFFNVLAMQHKFNKGSVTLFLSHDRVKELAHLNIQTQGDRGDIAEVAVFGRYHYEPRLLEAFELDSVLKLQAKLMKTEMPQKK